MRNQSRGRHNIPPPWQPHAFWKHITLTLDTGLRTGTYRLLALEVPTIENGTDTVWTDYGLGCRVRISAENHSATVLDTFNSEFELVGDGSETNPFIISSAEHLWRLRDFTNSDENNTKLTGKPIFVRNATCACATSARRATANSAGFR